MTPTTPSLGELAQKYGIASPKGMSAPAGGDAPSLTDLAKEYGVQDQGDIDLQEPADVASKVRNILAKKAPAIAAPSDQTNVGPYTKRPDYYGPSDVIDDVKDVVSDIVHNPGSVLKGLLTQPVNSFIEGTSTPVVGGHVSLPEAARARRHHVKGTPEPLPAGTEITKENTPDAITPGQQNLGLFNTAANVLLPKVPAEGILSRLAINAGLGSINDPENRLRGAVAGSVLGEALHGAVKIAPKVADVARTAGGKVSTALAERAAPMTEATTASERPSSPPIGLRGKLADLIQPAHAELRNDAVRAANTDALTGLANKRAYDAARTQAESDPNMSVVRFDMNGFKSINDNISHDAGDAALAKVGQVLNQAAKDMDAPVRVFRVGGDEFAALVPKDQAEAFRDRVEELHGVVDHGEGIRTSISGGVGDNNALADQAAIQRKAVQKAEQGISPSRPTTASPKQDLPVEQFVNEATQRIARGEDPSTVAADIYNRFSRAQKQGSSTDISGVQEPEVRAVASLAPETTPSLTDLAERYGVGREGLDGGTLAQPIGGPAPRRELTGDEMGGMDIPTPDLRDRIRKYAYEQLRGRDFTNTETGTDVRVNRRGIDKTLTHVTEDAAGRKHAQSMLVLSQMLEDATYLGSEAPRGEPDAALSHGTKAFHRFSTQVEIAGVPHHVTLVVRESPNGHFFYDHRLTTIEPATPSEAPVHHSQDGGSLGSATGSEAGSLLPSKPMPSVQDGGDVGGATGRTPETSSNQTAESIEHPLASPAVRRGPNAPVTSEGVTQGTFLSPASSDTPTGARWRQTLGLKPAQSEQVTALRKISTNLAEAVGVPLNEGRGNLKRMKALGAFFVKPETIRVRRLNALDTVSHEIGHFMSKTHSIKDLVRQSSSGASAMRQELFGAGKRLYGTRKPNGGYAEEGVAEWAKFYVTDPARMAREFPTFAPFADKILDANPALKVAMDKARADFERYDQSPASAKIRSMITTKLPSRFAVTPNDIVDYAFDDLAAFRRATEDLGLTHDPDKNAYTLARLTKGNPGRAKDIIDHGVVDFDNPGGARLSRGLPEILHDVAKDKDAFEEYLTARQVLTKHAQGIDTGFDVPAAVDVVQNSHSKPGFAKAAEELWDFRQKILHYRVDAGMMTQADFDAIVENNPTPTPFYRDISDSNANKGSGTRSMAKNSSGVHRLVGSSRPILNPLESVIKDAYETIDAAHKHEAATTLIRSALATEGGGTIAEILPQTPQQRVALSVGRVGEQLIDAGWQPPKGMTPADLSTMLEAFYDKAQMGGREAKDMVFPMLINGERKWIQINDKSIWEAIQGMSKPELGIFGKILGSPTRMLRMGATQLNPDFALTNPLRDAYQAAVMSRGPTRPPFYHLFRGLFHIGRERFGKEGDALFDRWMQEGGGNAGLVGNDRRALREQYKQMLREVSANQSVARAILDRVKHPLSTAREFFETFENSTRLGEFAVSRDQLMKQGASEAQASRQAALNSRDVTLDFAKSGRATRFANQFIPFLTAHMADIEQMAREHNPLNLKTPQGRARFAQVAGRATAYITIPSVALYLAQRNDPDYQEIPEYVKALSWVIIDHDHGPVPLGLKNGKRTRVWVIPRPHLLGFVYGYLPEKALSFIDKHDPHALGHAASQTVSALTPPFVPTAAVPIIEAWSNRSTFTGNPIVPESKARLPRPEQVQSHTGELARLLGRYTNQSPAMIEQVARDYTGGAGMGVNDVANAGIRTARENLGMPPLAPENTPSRDELKRIPVIRRFIMDQPGTNSQSVQQFYTDYDRAESLHSAWRALLKKGDIQGAAQYFKDHKADILSVASATENGTAGRLAQIHKEIAATSKQLNEARNSSTLAPENKAAMSRTLEQRLVQLARLHTHPTAGAPR
jgi:diguanylate cyclase (GGDEF)-like protein